MQIVKKITFMKQSESEALNKMAERQNITVSAFIYNTICEKMGIIPDYQNKKQKHKDYICVICGKPRTRQSKYYCQYCSPTRKK